MLKKFRSPGYNYNFDTQTGFFARWGNTPEEDPQMAPFPEIADIEISTVCHQMCKACYKGLSPTGKNMSLATFKLLMDKLPSSLLQIAFGVGTLDANPDVWSIFEHCRSKGVTPNVTINGYRMTPGHYDNLARLCGAVAVSHYSDDACFNAVKELTDRGLKQVNIHQLLAEETLADCHRLIDAKNTDSRLEKLNAIVFLLLKPKGERNTLNNITNRESYVELVRHAVDSGISFGFDSCFAPIFMDIAPDVFPQHKLDQILNSCEPCESFGLFSCYVDVDCNYHPCSFCPGSTEWGDGINILDVDDFVKDIWLGCRVSALRNKSLACGRRCLPYPSVYRGVLSVPFATKR
jgi:hypothetical protein